MTPVIAHPKVLYGRRAGAVGGLGTSCAGHVYTPLGFGLPAVKKLIALVVTDFLVSQQFQQYFLHPLFGH